MNKNFYFFLLFCITINSFAQTEYSTCGPNKISESSFKNISNGTVNVPGWEFTPAGNEDRGWVKEGSLIYGDYLYIDRIGRYEASPTDATVCSGNANASGVPKVVKFRYNSSNTGNYTLSVKLGTETIATFENDGGLARSKLITPSTVEAKAFKEILSTRYVDPISGETYRRIANNIWHDIELYIPNYSGGAGQLSFIYERLDGISRQVVLDEVELYDALPKPIPTQTEVSITDCDNPVFDLTTLQPAPSNGYVYEWHTVPNNPTAATLVNDPVNAASGVYYLYIADSDCTSSGCYSLASEAVTVISTCCGVNKILNGDFSSFTDNGDIDEISGWIPYRENGTQDANEFVSINVEPNFPDGSGSDVLFLDESLLQGIFDGDPYIEQPVKLCEGSSYELNFDYAMEIAGGYRRRFYIQIGEEILFGLIVIDRTGNDNDGIKVFDINPNVDVYFNGGSTPVEAYQNGTLGDDTGTKIANIGETIKIKAVIKNINNLPANPSLRLNFPQEGALVYFDNINLKSIPPEDVQMNTTTIETLCPTNLADLTSLVNTTNIINSDFNLTYEWHVANDATSDIVENPSEVGAGTYYLFAKSCEGCYSENGLEVTVLSNCPSISGSIFLDYDGASNGGIDNANGAAAQTTSGGGLYMILVNSSGNVTKSVQVSNDGTFSFSATSGNAYRLLVNNESINQGLPAPTASTLNPSWVHTGEAIDGVIDANANGQTETFNLSPNENKTNVNFGIQYQPVSNSAWSAICNNEGVTTTVPAITGLDDDPNFNEGIGQKLTLGTITTVNSNLEYNGLPLSNGDVIASYDPNLLTLTPIDPTEKASVNFDYKFTDSAGAESIEAGEINFRINKAVNATITASSITYCPSSSDPAPSIQITGLNGFNPYTIELEYNSITTTVETNTGEDTYSIDVPTASNGIHEYKLLSITDAIGCQVNFTDKSVTVFVGCDDTDGDGIIDIAEGYDDLDPNNSTDTDNDGIFDYNDLDADNDGILDSVEGLVDTDEDGIPNYQDLDADNDGKLDVDEAGNGNLDTYRNAYLDANDVDATGTALTFTNGLANANLSDATTLDADNDGIPNYLDPEDSVNNDVNNGGVSPTYPTGDDDDLDGILNLDDTYNGFGLKTICFKEPITTGSAESTYVGISTLDRNMENNWVSGVKNGFIKMESKTKGFVITRLTNTQIQGIENPQEGMLVWSTDDQCLKLNIDGTSTGWNCISQGCNQ